jgi:hypothetical protein
MNQINNMKSHKNIWKEKKVSHSQVGKQEVKNQKIHHKSIQFRKI